MEIDCWRNLTLIMIPLNLKVDKWNKALQDFIPKANLGTQPSIHQKFIFNDIHKQKNRKWMKDGIKVDYVDKKSTKVGNYRGELILVIFLTLTVHHLLACGTTHMMRVEVELDPKHFSQGNFSSNPTCPFSGSHGLYY